ncbi:uncharacterized protein LOC123661241 [Melitaea cinxia]|uniref:uncharacterized protein LOC123661241 n=1 Tax=Melitaea cinxia TaxID=113334 RepID=UPI001E274877|nr:uncharacterized protein LOC123661241 [Melitaea cinxia]
MARNRKSTPTTMPQTPRLARSMTTKRKETAVIESSVFPPPRRPRISNRPLKDTEIYKNLVSESDDNCSNFDDDVDDPDFVLESNHNTESEQSEDDENQAVNHDVNEGRQEEISLDHEHEENTSEIEIEGSHNGNGQNEEQDSNKPVRQEQCNEDSGINSYVLYNKCTNKVNMRRGPFLLSLARELVLPEMKLRVYNDRIPRELRLTIERVIRPTDMLEPPSPKGQANSDPRTRKTCAICPSRLKRRTKYYCYQCKKPMCLTCCLQICNDCILQR